MAGSINLLDRVARAAGVPMTRLVRQAIRRLREEQEAAPHGFDRLLRETAGAWKRGDGLAYQQRLRALDFSHVPPEDEPREVYA